MIRTVDSGAEPARTQLPNQLFRYGRAFIGHCRVTNEDDSRTDSIGQKAQFVQRYESGLQRSPTRDNPPEPSYRQSVRNTMAKLRASHLHKSAGINRSVRTSIFQWGKK